jgi:crotonobetainyl-CoA:carnitine CoA-transferase CaiB-like acyl-CoA transferase
LVRAVTGDAAPAAGPLAGVRVVDLTQVLAGPFCTMLLADLGADVVKVEPIEGDTTRTTKPFFEDDDKHYFGGYFQSVNRNKSGITVDLKQPAGREIVRRLARSAHVLVENFRVGVMERLDLSYEQLHDLNPRLVYACVRGFGDPRTGRSPYADWPAFDIVAQAMGGLMGITGPAPGEPCKVGPGIGDIFPATLLAFGIVAALRHAERTGEGQFVDVAMYDGILALCERIVYQYGYSGEIPHQQGNSHPLVVPFDVFKTKDGSVAIATVRDPQWAELCRRIGRPELAEDSRYKPRDNRMQHAAEVRRLVGDWAAVRTNREVMDALGGFVPAGPVQTAADIFADPHVAARNMIVSVEHPGSRRRGTIAGTPVKFTRTPSGPSRRAPFLGEHTAAILRELGYDDAEVRKLAAERVVVCEN